MTSDIKSKLIHEWKNLYPHVSREDGTTTKRQFEDALKTTGVFLNNQEIKYLLSRFGDGSSRLRIEDLSQGLGLHSNTIAIIRSTQDKIQRLKSAASKSVSRVAAAHPYTNMPRSIRPMSRQAWL